MILIWRIKKKYLLAHWRGEHGIIRSCIINDAAIGIGLHCFFFGFVLTSIFWQILIGVGLASSGLTNAEIEKALIVINFVGSIVFGIIPIGLWLIWAPVGVLRLGANIIEARDASLEKAIGIIPILWALATIFLSLYIDISAIKHFWNAGMLNPEQGFKEIDSRASRT